MLNLKLKISEPTLRRLCPVAQQSRSGIVQNPTSQWRIPKYSVIILHTIIEM